MSQIFQMADDKWYNPSTGQLGQEPTQVASPATDTMNVGSNPYAYDQTGETPAAESQPINTLYQTRGGDVIDLNNMVNTRGEELQSYIKEQGLTPYGSGSPTLANQPYHAGGTTPSRGGSGAGTNINIEKEEEKAPVTSAMDQLVNSPNPFTEEEAKQYAQLTGAENYKAFVGGIGGRENPMYIGPTNLNKLKGNGYTDYQIREATTRLADGSTYWNPAVSINDIPRIPPGTAINDFSKDILNVVSDGASVSDILTPNSQDSGLIDQGPTALEVYNQMLNTPELKGAKDKVMDLRYKMDEFDQQLEDLKKDIKKEVRGEAPESYINALAAVRGNEIMRLRRQVERDYNMALADYNSQKDIATARMEMIIRDNDNRYNRAFEALKFMEQQKTTEKSMDQLYLYAMLNLPEGTSYEFSDGKTVTGLKTSESVSSGIIDDGENISFWAVDRATGKPLFENIIIGKSKQAGTDYKSTLEQLQSKNMIDMIEGIASGKYIPMPSPDGKTTIYADVDSWMAETGRNFENKPGSDYWLWQATGWEEFWKHGGNEFVLNTDSGVTPYDAKRNKEAQGQAETPEQETVQTEEVKNTEVFKPGEGNKILVNPDAMNWMFSPNAKESFNKLIKK